MSKAFTKSNESKLGHDQFVCYDRGCVIRKSYKSEFHIIYIYGSHVIHTSYNILLSSRLRIMFEVPAFYKLSMLTKLDGNYLHFRVLRLS